MNKVYTTREQLWLNLRELNNNDCRDIVNAYLLEYCSLIDDNRADTLLSLTSNKLKEFV